MASFIFRRYQEEVRQNYLRWLRYGTRDLRDPQKLGEAILSRPKGMSVLEAADRLNQQGE